MRVAVAEHRRRQEQGAGLLYEAPAEGERAFRCVEARKADTAGARPDEAQQSRPLGPESLEPVEVAADDAEVAGDDPLALAQTHERQDLTGGAGADRRVVLVRRQARVELAVPRGQPAHAQAGHRVGLRHPREGDGLAVSLDRRRQPRRRFLLEAAVHLVGEQVGPRLLGDVEQLLVLGAGRQVARRVMRKVGHDQPRGRAERAAHEGGIEAPALLLVGLPVGDLATEPLGDAVERLIARMSDDHMIAGLEQDGHGDEDALFGHDLEDVVGRDAVVCARDLRSQLGQALGLGVAQPEILPQPAALVVRPRHDLGQRVALAIGAGQRVARAELVERHVALQVEGFGLHASSRLSAAGSSASERIVGSGRS